MEEEKKAHLEFTESEATQLVKILDFTVKQVGIADGGETANNAIYFLNKLNLAFQEKPEAEKK